MDENNEINKELRKLPGEFVRLEAFIDALQEFLKEGQEKIEAEVDKALEEAFESLGNPRVCKEIYMTIKKNPGIGFNELCREIEKKRAGSRSTVSKYLSLLEQARLVEKRREGKKTGLYLTDYQSEYWKKFWSIVYLAMLGRSVLDVLKYEKKNKIRDEEDIEREAIQFFEEYEKLYILLLAKLIDDPDLSDTDRRVLEELGLRYLRGLEFHLLLGGWKKIKEPNYEFVESEILENLSKLGKYGLELSLPYQISKR